MAAKFCLTEAELTRDLFIQQGRFKFECGILSDPTDIDVPHSMSFYISAAQFYSNAGLYDDARRVLQKMNLVLGIIITYTGSTDAYQFVRDYSFSSRSRAQTLLNDINDLSAASAPIIP